jgi:hypothetical protein
VEEDKKETGEKDLLDNPKHPIRTMLSNRTIVKARSSRILVVNSRKSSSSIHCPISFTHIHWTVEEDLHLPESKAPASDDLLQTFVPSDSVAVC